MHAKTETNATILSLLYPASSSRGVFKILKKKHENTPQLQVEGYLKFSKKKKENTPQVQVEGYNKDKNSSLFRVPRDSKWSGTRKSEKVGHFCNFLKK